MAEPLNNNASRPRTLSLLGSTGSIGLSTLDLVARNLDAYDVVALTAHSNVTLLAQQARQFQPRVVAIGDPAKYQDLRDALAGTNITVLAGPEGLVEAASYPSDWMIAGIVGAAGLEPTLAGVRRGATVALANKECLVCAGELFTKEVTRSGATLLPVDSEHNAIFQVFDFDHPERVEKIILTASGGPFRTFTLEEMSRVTPAQAVKHPNWSMGAKISIDSATLMNKGLEAIEAFHLFPVSVEQIEVLVHPQSVIHSMVSYVDGSVLAQLGSPDMRTPIAHALAWPDRMETPVTRLDLGSIGRLDFEAPDLERFPALRLAREALQSGGGAPTILNAANEVAVEGFLQERIAFLDIPKIVQDVLERMGSCPLRGWDDLAEIDSEARSRATAMFG
ncbi:1-deoxy-D-xylulose-5-phosphate reductoisomerase [Iodidimonas sp. SYSU 1G8]|uniref:1-deoxy-D-xylulose-5-phosphate reductoisomerase n=1 Tax=Iodidimonas sp. SYSU 1G8 TaxID=3133967 RepID=UPI0031FE47AE